MCIRNRKHFKSRIKATWKLNGTWRCLFYILSKWNGKARLSTHSHSCFMSLWLTSAGCFSFPGTLFLTLFYYFPVFSHRFHFSFKHNRVLTFIFSITNYVSSLFCAIPSPSRRGGKPTSFSPKTMVDPPSFLRLPGSLLEGEEGKAAVPDADEQGAPR